MAVLIGLVFLIGGCAEVVAGTTLEQEVTKLRGDLDALRRSVQRSRGEAEKALSQLEQRVRTQHVESQKQLLALMSRTAALNNEIEQLASRLDDVARQLVRLSQALEAASARPLAEASRPSIGTAPSAEIGAPPAEIYQAASSDLSKGNYELAIPGFRAFLRQFPRSDLADDAQYSIGEALFSSAQKYATQGRREEAKQSLERATLEFRKVIVNYPRGDKAPTALYKEALALLELKRERLALARLQYLLKHFPLSEEAPLARERLAAVKESVPRAPAQRTQ
ncbi:MAG: outer membrane protein assembly factor BamD [Candidatus Methylomirabilia bacterium]